MLPIEYIVEAENEDEALDEIADLLKRDWPYLIDRGELIELPKTLTELWGLARTLK